MALNRRTFLKTAASATALGSMRLASAAESGATPPSQAELAGWLIDSDRKTLIEQLVQRIRAGLDYPTLLGAVAEASARTVRPYPHVGFKYHAFMVLHAVHLSTRLGRPRDRWLPVLWSADVLKASQAAEQRRGNWALRPVPEHLVPAAGKAEGEFRRAMEQWDPEAAEAAVVGLARSAPRDRVFELLFRYGARDFRAIGHKAITVANCHRLSAVVSLGHGEPMLRSLVLALLNHRGEPNPSASDLPPDRPWRQNLAASEQEPPPPRSGSMDGGEVAGMLEVLREGSSEDAGRALLDHLNRGLPASELWTAIFAAAGDLMLRKSGIIAVHANTASNALYYGYAQSDDAATRRLLLLQAASFLPLFRDLIGEGHKDLGIDTLAALENRGDTPEVLDDIFATISVDRIQAARKVLGFLGSGGAELPFRTLARQYVVDRNTGYHDYKFAEAVFENAAFMRPPWRARYLASSVLYLNGSGDKPNETVQQARALLG